MPAQVSKLRTIYITHPYQSPSYVYRIFAADGLLLYIGSTTNISVRLEHHARAAWFFLADRVELEEFSYADEARAAERAAIRWEDPAANVVWTARNNGRGAAAVDPRLVERGVSQIDG